jgi:hypothetical protein
LVLEGRASIARPGGVTKVSTEGVVENDVMALEVVIDVAVWSVEDGIRCWPCRWVGFAQTNVGWNRASGEEPDLDGIRCPFHGIDTAAVCVEARTIADRALGEGTTTLCVGTGVDVVLAVVAVGGAGHLGRRLGNDTGASGVERCEIHALVVRSFNDIDLSVVRPRSRSESPEGRPGTATTGVNGGGHVFDIGDE